MDERRQEARQRRLKSGTIIFNNRNSTMDCQLRDVSAHGARLKCANTFGLPDEFELNFPGAIEKQWGRRTWQRYDEIGVEFL
jgi:hypothetical protein